ncbi:hypothetical protein [Paenibacillus sp. MABNR03]|uniref:hypothetical protein n=1 Tax=Paenibacillus sp. MABNR03 TaxID=3142626 RepID=UPI003D2E2E48
MQLGKYRRIKKESISISNILYIIIFLSVAIAIIVNALLILPLPGIRTVQNNDWIGFYGNLAGAFIGAAVTVFIFRETLQSGKKSESEARRYQVIPFLNAEMEIIPFTSVPLSNITWMFFDSHNQNPHFAIKLNIFNIGQGLAADFNIRIDGYSWTQQSQAVTFIQQTGMLTKHISLPIPIQDNCELTIRFKFIDIIENEYEQIYKINILNPSDTPQIIYSHRDRPKLVNTKQ